MCPLAHADGHDAPRLGFELVPRVAAMIDEIVFVEKDAVGQPVVTQELPYVLLRVELGALGRQRYDGDVGRHNELGGEMPPGLVKQQSCVAPGGDVGGDGGEVQVHRRDVAPGQDQPDRLALVRTDGAKDVGRGGALVDRSGRSGSAPRPTAGDLGLLTDPGFVAKPNLYVAGCDALVLRDRVQTGGEIFLKASIAPAACA